MNVGAVMRMYLISIPVLLALSCCGRLSPYPYPLEGTHSHESLALQKPVKAERSLKISTADWHIEGMGRIDVVDDRCLDISYPSQPAGVRAKGSPDDPDYATYGTCRAVCDLHGADWSGFDRIVMEVYPHAPGLKVAGLNLTLSSQQDAHLMNMVPNEWNTCFLDLGMIALSNLRFMSLHTTIKGKDRTAPDSIHYYVKNIRLQKLETVGKQMGWEPEKDMIIYSTLGYDISSQKTAIIGEGSLCETFSVETESGDLVFQGRVDVRTTTLGTFGVMDFTALTIPGRYILRAGELATASFTISNMIWHEISDKLLSFIHAQRCGWPVTGVHSACHHDVFALHEGKMISYGGGWHDAGDLSQQTLQTADVAYALLEAYQAVKDSDKALAKRLLHEARWGFDFVLNSRFEDGWHASSMGLLHWTDDTVGSFDDITTVRTQNNAFDNFLYAGYEAYAARVFSDKEYARQLLQAAQADYAFAVKKFETEGFDNYQFQYEHVFNTSHSQFMATASWAASQLYGLTGASHYAVDASRWMRYVLACQETEKIAGKYAGFFYRDTAKVSIVHFIHQSRDQIYAQALIALLESQPAHEGAPLWRACLELYASYLKSLMEYTSPYGMIPSGIYSLAETADREGFHRLHIFAPSDALERYAAQVKNGQRVDDTHYIKRFPVWFNIFSGNNAVILATAKAAALCGSHFSDETLLQIAREQIYWIVGKNPFGQSMIYGVGNNYPSMSSFSSGELTGEIAVGIKTMGEDDIPYWPAVNCACYKEVWTPCAGKTISLMSELLNQTCTVKPNQNPFIIPDKHW